jgi:hypothetical protein
VNKNPRFSKRTRKITKTLLDIYQEERNSAAAVLEEDEEDTSDTTTLVTTEVLGLPNGDAAAAEKHDSVAATAEAATTVTEGMGVVEGIAVAEGTAAAVEMNAANYSEDSLQNLRESNISIFNSLLFRDVDIEIINQLFPLKKESQSLDPPMDRRVSASSIREWRKLGKRAQAEIIRRDSEKENPNTRSLPFLQQSHDLASSRMTRSLTSSHVTRSKRVSLSSTATDLSQDVKKKSWKRRKAKDPPPGPAITAATPTTNVPMPRQPPLPRAVSPEDPIVIEEASSIPPPPRCMGIPLKLIAFDHRTNLCIPKSDLLTIQQGYCHLIGEARHNLATAMSQGEEWPLDYSSLGILDSVHGEIQL